MKRKQKLPRRTRRLTSSKPAHDALLLSNPKNDEKKFLRVEESSKMSQPQCASKDKNDVHSEKLIHLENDFSTENAKVEKKNQEAYVNPENFIGNKLGNTTVDGLKQGLKRRSDDRLLSGGLKKRSAACGNFRNELEDSKMPIILEVFTLSEEPPSYIKKKTTDTIRENNFPVTPPCSPPLINLDHFTCIESYSFREKNTMRSFSGSGVGKQSFNNPTTVSSVPNIHISTTTDRHDRQNANYGFPLAMNQHMYQTNSTTKDETRKCYNANYGDSIQTPTVKDNMFSSANKFAPAGVLLDERKLIPECSNKNEQEIFEAEKPSNLCVNSRLLQDAQRNNFSNYELLKFANQEKEEVTKTGLKCLPDSNSNVGFCDRMGQTLKEHETGSVQNWSIKSNFSCKLSDAVSQSIDEYKDGAKRSNAFLSPRDIKVLQLKKRLREQEALLNKLRKNH